MSKKNEQPVMHGVWATWQDYCDGNPPIMVGESRWDEVVSSVQAEGSAARSEQIAAKNVLVCTRAGETWIPLSFLRVSTGNSSSISEQQAKKYLSRRASNSPNDEIPGVDDARSADDGDDPAVSSEGSHPGTGSPADGLVLTLTPHIAELLRDTFSLVARGQSVTIQTVSAPAQ